MVAGGERPGAGHKRLDTVRRRSIELVEVEFLYARLT